MSKEVIAMFKNKINITKSPKLSRESSETRRNG